MACIKDLCYSLERLYLESTSFNLTCKPVHVCSFHMHGMKEWHGKCTLVIGARYANLIVGALCRIMTCSLDRGTDIMLQMLYMVNWTKAKYIFRAFCRSEPTITVFIYCLHYEKRTEYLLKKEMREGYGSLLLQYQRVAFEIQEK